MGAFLFSILARTSAKGFGEPINININITNANARINILSITVGLTEYTAIFVAHNL